MTDKANFKKNEKSEIDVNLKLPIIRSVEGSLFKDHRHVVKKMNVIVMKICLMSLKLNANYFLFSEYST